MDIPVHNEQEHGCYPDEPVHHNEDNHEECHGTIKLDCHCKYLRTHTFVMVLGPQTEATLTAYVNNTYTAWQDAGYTIHGHSLTDTGAGWLFMFTVGWHA